MLEEFGPDIGKALQGGKRQDSSEELLGKLCPGLLQIPSRMEFKTNRNYRL